MRSRTEIEDMRSGRQAIIVSNGDPAVLVDHPIAVAFLVMALAAAVMFLKRERPGGAVEESVRGHG